MSYLPKEHKKEKKLTEKQQLFLDKILETGGNLTKAAFKLLEVLESDRPIPQANNKLQAAQTILDRVGLAKSDRVQVDHNVPGGIFILPEKESLPVVEGDYETIPD